MRIALVNTNKRSPIPPLALLKIGSYLKKRGDDVKIYENVLPDSADEIWITTVFTFDIPYVRGIIKEAKRRSKIIKLGGVSASLLPEKYQDLDIDIHIGLLPGAEKESPDYSLLEKLPETNISHTSRGCIRKCKFCCVPKIEPDFYHRDWIKDIHPKIKKINFFDNNWLAKDEKDWFNDIEILKDLVESKRITSIDFEQGIDARILTKEKAEAMAGLPIKPIRFAFDSMSLDGKYQRAIELMIDNGFKTFLAYKLYNFNDKPEDFYYRLKESVKLTVKHNVGVHSFPTRYQPIMEVNIKRNFTGKHWNIKMVHAFIETTAKSSMTGIVSPGSIEEFEYWYGKTGEEFKKLLNYPKINLLLKRKRAYLRENRDKVFNQKQ